MTRARLAAALVPCLFACRQAAAPPAPETRVVATATPAAAGAFIDQAARAGLDFRHDNGRTGRRYLPETMGAGSAILDYDNDGNFDIYLVQSGPLTSPATAARASANRLFRGLGDGRFEDRSDGSGADDAGYGMGVVAADYDNDGNTDLYVCNFGRNTLLRNRGDGGFDDVTAAAGVGDSAWSSSAVFFDGDGDGDLDLFVANYLDFAVAKHMDCGDVAGGETAYCHPDAYPFAPDVFYRNRGDGSFLDATTAAGFDDRDGKGLGVVAADLTGDGLPDVYVANDSTPNFLFRNLGHGRFAEEGTLWGVSHNEDGQTEAGMGIAVGDADGDGRLDLFVTNLSKEANALYLGGADRFTYATRSAGLYDVSFADTGFGVDFLDLDNDADLDLFIVNGHVIDNIAHFNDSLTFRQPIRVMRNDGTGRFTELPSAEAGAIAEPLVGRGSSTLDLHDDGRLDVVVTENGGPVHLFENHVTPPGNWIGFHLHQSGGNRAAVGARVMVETAGRHQLRDVQAGSGYQSSAEPRLHFGIGGARQADRVTVTWPDGGSESAVDLGAGVYHSWIRGRGPGPPRTPP